MTGFESAKKIFKEANNEYQELIGRKYGSMLEITGDKNAKVAVMALGTMGEECEAAIDLLDEKGIKAKVVRPRVFRPFPKEELIDELKDIDKVLILDRAVSFGNEGQLAIETKVCLFSAGLTNIKVTPKIVGLGGMDVNFKDIAKMIEEL
jgi:pyruvate ferredoxin oxidoreductase alpha subunit